MKQEKPNQGPHVACGPGGLGKYSRVSCAPKCGEGLRGGWGTNRGGATGISTEASVVNADDQVNK